MKGLEKMKYLGSILVVVMVFVLVSTAISIEPPSPGELERYRMDGTLGQRMQFAYSLGNHIFNPSLVERKALIEEAKRKGIIFPAEQLPYDTGVPSHGTPKLFAVLVEFPDDGNANNGDESYPGHNPESLFEDRIFGDGTGIGFPYESLSNYYYRSSYENLDIQGDVYGWYQADHPRDHYNNSPNSQDGVRALVQEVLDHYDSTGVDFTQYDNDGDGDIDFFSVLWAGPHTGWGSQWWAWCDTHAGIFYGSSYKVDGKSIGVFCWQYESRYRPGFPNEEPAPGAFWPRTLIHETGHGLGLPDYYDYDGSVGPDGGVGGLDMMDGNWGDHNCFSKWMLEWLSPSVVIGTAGTIHSETLTPSSEDPNCVVIMPGQSAPGDPFNEFFMVQHRKPTENDGGTGIPIPTDGFLIWHVDSTLNADGNGFAFNNSYTDHKLLRLMEADGLEEIEQNLGANSGDFYRGADVFSRFSTPNSADYSGSDTWVTVRDIYILGSIVGADMFIGPVSPVADANGSYSGIEGSPISFDGAGSYDPDGGSITSYEWDMDGDGQYDDAVGVAPSWTWPDDHNGTVALRVTDDEGATGTDSASVVVNNVAPTVEVGPNETIDEGDTFTRSGVFTDPGADSWTGTVDYGDGTGVQSLPLTLPDKTFSLSHLYTDNGINMVTVEIADDDGGTDSDTAAVIVLNVAPEVTIDSITSPVDEGSVLTGSASFTDPGADNPWSVEVDYGDGSPKEYPIGVTPGDTISLSHVYADNGTYTVEVKVTDKDSASGTDSVSVTVNNVAPTVDAGVDQTVDEGDLVNLDPATFNDSGTLDTHTATIDWGDGSPLDVGVVTEVPSGPPGDTAGADGTVAGSHVYADNGSYTVTVKVTDDDGASTSDTLIVTVNNVAPTVDAGPDQIGRKEGELVSLAPATFNDLGTLDTHTATVDWGDSSPLDINTTVVESPFGPPGATSGADGDVLATHVYGDNGLYTVTVEVTDDDGGVGSDTFTIEVLNVAPTVTYTGSDKTGSAALMAGDYTAFDPATYSDPGWLDTHTAEWNFGDPDPDDPDNPNVVAGSVAPDPLDPPNPVTGTVTVPDPPGGHSYFRSGDHTVTVTVTDDDGASGSDTLTVTVEAIPATIFFDMETLNKSGGEKWFTVYIELPERIEVEDISLASILLNGQIPAETDPQYGFVKSPESYLMDSDKDGELERMVKFPREDVAEILETGDQVDITVTGCATYTNDHDITGCADFEGTNVIRVIEKGKEKPPKSDVVAAPALPTHVDFQVLEAFPQPCNPDVWLPYTLGNDVAVKVSIYSSSGKLIRVLDLGHKSAGVYTSKEKAAHWDGRNQAGEQVSSGIYFFTIEAGDQTAIKKIVVNK